jgi:hypothetical protein
MDGIGAVGELLVVIALLIGGTWINRDFNPGRRRRPRDARRIFDDAKMESHDGFGETAVLVQDNISQDLPRRRYSLHKSRNGGGERWEHGGFEQIL